MDENILSLGSADGLPNLQIHNMVFDKFQRLWASGPAGLVCYTGDYCKVFDTSNILECVGLRTVTIEQDKHLWLGTDRGIESLNLDGSKRSITVDFEWTYGIAECFHFDNNTLWIGTSFGILELREEEDALQLINSYPIGLVSQIIKIENVLTLVSLKQGILKLQQGTFVNGFDTLDHSITINHIEKTLDKQLLIGTSNGLYITSLTGEIRHHYKVEGSIFSVRKICRLHTSWILLYSDRIEVVHENSFRLQVLESIYIPGSLTSIRLDTYDNIWVGTNNDGIKKVSVFRKSINKLDVGSDKAVFSLFKYPDSRTIAVGGEGFHSVIKTKKNGKSSRVKEFHQIDGVVWDVLVLDDSHRTTYLATQEGIYTKSKKQKPILNQKLSSQIGAPCRVLLERKGKIYIGSVAGLFCLQNEIITEIYKKNGEQFGYVYSMSLDEEQRLWVSTLGQGLWKETKKGFEHPPSNLTNQKGNTYASLQIAEGRVISQNENLILHTKENKDRLIDQSFPIAGWALGLLENNTIIAGTDDGVSIYELDTNIKTKLNIYLPLAHWQATSSRSILSQGDGSFLYGQISGLFSINYRDLKSIKQLPVVKLDTIKWTIDQPTWQDEILTIKYGKWTFEAKIYCSWHLDAKLVSYRYKLIGFDENWSDLDPNYKINYNSLPPGNYELMTQAHTAFTGFGEAVSILKLRVLQPKGKTKIQENFLSIDQEYQLKEYLKRNKALISQNKHFAEEIEERRKAESELKIYKEDLEALIQKRTTELVDEKKNAEYINKLKTLFLAAMSHEIRTPLSGILGLAELLKNSKLNSIQRDYINKLDRSSQHLLEIVNNVLDIAKIESGKTVLKHESFSLYDLIEEIADLAQVKNNHKKVNLFFDIDSSHTKLLLGDKTRLKQVIINLLSNAIKFTEQGNVVFSVKEIQRRGKKITLTFSVKDAGVGIDTKETPTLKNAFQQADNQKYSNIEGSGLGLNISNNIIEMMGGELDIESDLGVGSTFAFTINLEEDITEDTYSKLSIADELSSKRVGIYISDLEEEEVILRTLKKIGFSHINVYQDQATLIKAILDSSIEICIVDEDLKNQTTLKNYKRKALLDSQEYVKSIILSPTNNYQIVKILKQTGFDQVLLKPFAQFTMLATIENLYKSTNELEKDIKDESITTEDNIKPNFDKHVLIAEDDSINQLIIKKFVMDMGCRITIVTDGNACIEKVKNDPTIDLVLMDIQMPRISGIEATRIIRKEINNSKLPIIAFTADVSTQLISNIESLGMNGFVSKPIDRAHLEKILTIWLKD